MQTGNFDSHDNWGAPADVETFRNPLAEIMEENFPSNHLLKITLVHQVRDKDYKKSIFAFLTGVPSGKKDQYGNSTYIKDKFISFKLEIPQLIALAKAFSAYATGQGTRIASKYLIWADPRKTEFVTEETKEYSGKCFTLADVKDTGKMAGEQDRIVFATFNRGKNAGAAKTDHDSFTVSFKPFDALAVADSIMYMVEHARKLMLAGYQPGASAHRRTFAPNRSANSPAERGQSHPAAASETRSQNNAQTANAQTPAKPAVSGQGSSNIKTPPKNYDPYAEYAAEEARLMAARLNGASRPASSASPQNGNAPANRPAGAPANQSVNQPSQQPAKSGQQTGNTVQRPAEGMNRPSTAMNNGSGNNGPVRGATGPSAGKGIGNGARNAAVPPGNGNGNGAGSRNTAAPAGNGNGGNGGGNSSVVYSNNGRSVGDGPVNCPGFARSVRSH